MGRLLSSVSAPIGLPVRLLLFAVAAGVGTFGGYGWSLELSDVPYDAMLQLFLEPGFQVGSLALAVTLGFTLGFAHIVRICYLPAALAVMPLLQATRDRRDFLRTAAILMLCMVLVCALWGAVVGMPAAALAGTVGSRRVMGLIMQPVLIVMGVLMLLVASSGDGLDHAARPDRHGRADAARRAG
jgi:hypothetical protein